MTRQKVAALTTANCIRKRSEIRGYRNNTVLHTHAERYGDIVASKKRTEEREESRVSFGGRQARSITSLKEKEKRQRVYDRVYLQVHREAVSVRVIILPLRTVLMKEAERNSKEVRSTM